MRKAFTILELLVVIAIIAILAVAAIPNFVGRIQDAQDARELAEIASVKKAADLYHMANSSWPTLQGADPTLGQPQPVFGSPHNIDFSKLVPNYLEKLPHFSYWWVDYTGLVYHTKDKFVDISSESILIAENTSGKLMNSDGKVASDVQSGDLVSISGGKYLVLSTKGRALPVIGEAYKGEKHHPEAGDSNSNNTVTPIINQSPVLQSIVVSPEHNLTTSTDISWSYTYSDSENDEIIAEEWEGKETKYTTSGVHTVRLRIKDSLNNWSEWAEKEITISKAPVLNLSAFANVRYVSTTGSDTTGDGTASNPYATLKQALVGITSNTCIYIKSGLYTLPNENYSMQTSGVAILGEPGAVLHSPIYNEYNINESTTITGLTFTGKFKVRTQYYNKTILFENCAFSLSEHTGTFGNYPFHITLAGTLNITNSSFINIRNTTGQHIAIDGSGTGTVKVNLKNNAYSNSLLVKKISSGLTLTTTDLTNIPGVTFDSDYNIITGDWLNKGTGTNLDGSQANIGVYGGRYSW